MQGQERSVAEVLRDPDARYKNPQFPDREISYKWMTFHFHEDGAEVELTMFLKLVVAFRPAAGYQIGTVITAFPASKIREGEERLWSKNEPLTGC